MKMKLKNILNEIGISGIAQPYRQQGGSLKEDEQVKLSKEQKKEIQNLVSNYNQYGKELNNEKDLIKIAQDLSALAEKARQYASNEGEDWFDRNTVDRNMKDLKKLSDEFSKVAKEAHIYQQRLSALYDDMGHVLARYFEIKNEQN
jgi:hypothetical protein